MSVVHFLLEAISTQIEAMVARHLQDRSDEIILVADLSKALFKGVIAENALPQLVDRV